MAALIGCASAAKWNTFETAGVCPQCRHRWRVTGCPPIPGGCGAYSPHVDWYHGMEKEIAALLEAALSAPAAVCCSAHES